MKYKPPFFLIHFFYFYKRNSFEKLDFFTFFNFKKSLVISAKMASKKRSMKNLAKNGKQDVFIIDGGTLPPQQRRHFFSQLSASSLVVRILGARGGGRSLFCFACRPTALLPGRLCRVGGAVFLFASHAGNSLYSFAQHDGY
jgi:hypothetical protein